MSLRVWLPLNGDLRNQGISDLNTIIMPTCATIDNTGKIGKCYTSDGSVAGVSTNFNFQASEFSIAAWVRINTRVNAWRCPIKLIHSTEKDYIGFCCEHNTQASYIGFHFYKTIDNTNTPIFDTYPITDMPIGEWVHLTVTYNGKTAIYYKNGIKINSSTIAAAKQNAIANIDRIIMLGSDGGRSGAAVKSSLNDVRIYDHCLSAAEVKEIAQGLILHYKLDEGNENLLLDTPKSYSATAYNAYQFDMKENLVAGQTYTLQLWDVTVEHSAKTAAQMNLQVYWGGGSVRLFNFSGATYFTTLQDHYAYSPYLCAQITPTSANASGAGATNAWLNIYNSVSNVDGIRNMKIGAWKLEKGSFATQWISSDTDMTKIQDSSGYNHNLTLTGNLLNDNTAPRYSTSMAFNGATVATAASTGADIRTISCWVKTTKNKSTSQIFIADSGSNMCVSFYSGAIIGVFGTVRNTGSKCILGSSYKENDWNHIVVVKTSDDGMRDIWCNGEKLTPAANDYWSAASGIWLGARNSSLGQPFYGSLSDVRFYCTPLLDTDIKQLYNVGMKIDKVQNIHNFELIEKNYNVLAAAPLCDGFNTHAPFTSPFLNFNSVDEPQFITNNSSAGTDYLEITPGIYEYDYTISVNSGNQFYIGFERYDANKTSRSNNACVYTYSTKPSANVVKQRYKGTVDLSTDGVNQLKYIALRILNGWSGTTSGVTGQATVHNLSLRLQSAAANPQLTKAGQLIGDEFKEYLNAKFYKDHIVEVNQFIER